MDADVSIPDVNEVEGVKMEMSSDELVPAKTEHSTSDIVTSTPYVPILRSMEVRLPRVLNTTTSKPQKRYRFHRGGPHAVTTVAWDRVAKRNRALWPIKLGRVLALLRKHSRLVDTNCVMPLLDVIADRGQTFAVRDCIHGDLSEVHRSHVAHVPEHTANALFWQVAYIVHRCHTQGVVLTGIKPSRFVFASFDRTCLRLDCLDAAFVIEAGQDQTDERDQVPHCLLPPEASCQSTPYSGRASNLWQLGLVYFFLLTGRLPLFGTTTEQGRAQMARICSVDSGLVDISEQARDLLKSLLDENPSRRISTFGVLNHPLFAYPSPGHRPTVRASKSSAEDQVVPNSSVEQSLHNTRKAVG